MLKARQRVTGQPTPSLLRHMAPHIPAGDWPTRQDFSNEFMNHAERIAAQLDLTGWHQMNVQMWDSCARAAKETMKQ